MLRILLATLGDAASIPGMANLQIKNVPEPLHEELRRRAAQSHQTVRDYVLQLIVADQQRQTTADWLRTLERHPPSGVSSAEIQIELDRGRREREDHLVQRHLDLRR